VHTLEVSSCLDFSYAKLQRNGVSVTSHCKPGTNRLMRTSNVGFRSYSVTSMYGRLHSHHIFDVSTRRACKPFGFLKLPLRALAKLRKATISFLMSVCLHGINGLPLNGFSLNLISVGFSKTCLEFSNFIKIWQENRGFTLLIYLLTPWSRVLLEKLTSKLCS
jgi:hypothetical protein